MGRLILILIGAFLAVMLVMWTLSALMTFFWIAVIVALGIAVLRLGLWAGRKSR